MIKYEILIKLLIASIFVLNSGQAAEYSAFSIGYTKHIAEDPHDSAGTTYLSDPEENGFALEMWNNTDPKKIFELSKRISDMSLSMDAKKIYTKLVLTNSYSPIDKIDEKVFLDIKSNWLIKFKDINLIKEYLKKNVETESNEQLTKFVLDELFSVNENKQACEFLEELNSNFNDDYLKKFSIYCLIYLKKNEQASLRYDLEKELGYDDPFFEK